MIFVFDVDDTITHYPEQCREMMAALKQTGNTVYVLTGAYDPGTESNRRAHGKIRREQLEGYGIHADTHYDLLEIGYAASGRQSELSKFKAGKLQEWGAHCFIDNCSEYCDDAKKLCPTLFVLNVWRVR
jgi:hypothetical protein